jgi:hypothetical protein
MKLIKFKKKGKKLSFTSPEKGFYFFYIYEVFTLEFFLKRSITH